MITRLLSFFKGSQHGRQNFFRLPSGEQKKLIKQAAQEANRAQSALVETYQRKLGDSQSV
ncbi:MAG: hypothetical protein AAB424_02925 [Patescibacteria group bacterium]